MQVMTRRQRNWFRGALASVLLLGLPGCVAQYRNHGYVPSPDELAEIKVGVDTRDSVAEAVGAPSAGGVLDNSGYYYVSSRVRTYGLRKPQVVDRQLVAISFDTRGVVRNVERFGLEDGRVIPLDRRVTDSAVSNKTFLRQLLGNIGNVNPGTFLNQ
jgi:outer membrane protein assembly factor BamE (lipoprotein component of BamABCDE complex)